MTSDLMMNTIMTMTQRDGKSENAMNGEAKRNENESMTMKGDSEL